MQMVVLHVYTKGFDSWLRDQLFRFCNEHLYVINFFTCIGEWDFEIYIELSDPEKSIAITQELYARFSNEIRKISILPVFRSEKKIDYPFAE
jgi:hypothetical protein